MHVAVMREAPSCSSLECIASDNNDPCPYGGLLSRLFFYAQPFEDYIIAVSGHAGRVGSFELIVNVPLPPPRKLMAVIPAS